MLVTLENAEERYTSPSSKERKMQPGFSVSENINIRHQQDLPGEGRWQCRAESALVSISKGFRTKGIWKISSSESPTDEGLQILIIDFLHTFHSQIIFNQYQNQKKMHSDGLGNPITCGWAKSRSCSKNKFREIQCMSVVNCFIA